MKYLPDEGNLPYGPATVVVTCDNCGEPFSTDETTAESSSQSDHVELLCDDCREKEKRERLISALLSGDDEVFSRAKAAMYLNLEFDDVFPIHDPENNRWIMSAEEDRLDGTIFIGSWVEIIDSNESCQACGNSRRRNAHGTNGIIDWHRESCTICERVFSEDAG